MSSPWDPPLGYFPDAVTWFHPGNINRFRPIYRADSSCSIKYDPYVLYNFSPNCDGSAINKPVHIWKGDPISLEAWALVTGCQGFNYIITATGLPAGHAYHCTMGGLFPATVNQFGNGAQRGTPANTPYAIRYGWLFSDQALSWWTHTGLAMHWLGPA